MITYLYLKQHAITGLKYFGRTNKNPYRYKGSGVKWLAHLKKHGRDVINVEVWGFDDERLCEEFAVWFSLENNIVDSDEWANLIVEDGGGSAYNPSFLGVKHSAETKAKMSANRPKGPSGKKWYNNGTHQTYCLPENAPEGYVLGRSTKSPIAGKSVYNDGFRNTYFFPNEVPEGYIPGPVPLDEEEKKASYINRVASRKKTRATSKKIDQTIYKFQKDDVVELCTRVELCEKYNLKPTMLCNMVKGKASHHKGWRIIELYSE